MKVLFGICTLSSKINVDTIVSLQNTYDLLDKEGIEHDTLYISGKSPVASARGDLVGIFLKTEHDVLFSLDDDVAFPAEAVLKLLNSPVKVIGGAYPIKADNEWHFAGVPHTEDGIPIGTQGLISAKGVAGGFMRIKREVIEAMVKEYPELEYVEYGRTSYNLFAPYIEDKHLWGDDYAFCHRWTAIGGQLWIEPDIDFVHIGGKKYKGNYHKYLLTSAKGNAKLDCVKDGGLPGWMTEYELLTLRDLAKKSESIVEVGSWKGRGTKEFLEHCKGTVYAVDNFKGSKQDSTEVIALNENIYDEFVKNVGHYSNLEIFKGDSVDIANNFNGTKVDMVFIDAGHTYEECKADIEAWLPKCNKIIAGHDYSSSWPGVKKAVNETFSDSINVVDSIWWVDLQKEN